MRKEKIDQSLLAEAKRCAEVISKGGILLYPADTLWGLGCDATNLDALKRLMEIKQRPEDKSFITLVSNWRMLQNVVSDIPEIVEELLEMSTEPITIIYPKANPAYKHLCSKDGKIAVRLIEEGFSTLLMDQVRKPLTSTSANLSGEKNPLSIDEVSDEIMDLVDDIASKDLHYKLTGKASKVILIEMDGRIKILR